MKITKYTCIGLGMLVVFGLGLYFGEGTGRTKLIRTLIDNCENGGEPFKVVSDVRGANFIYELKAECLGD